MSRADIASIKWEEDGEFSLQDTFNLVNLLAKIEDQEKVSALLHLSSKHRHSRLPKRSYK